MMHPQIGEQTGALKGSLTLTTSQLATVGAAPTRVLRAGVFPSFLRLQPWHGFNPRPVQSGLGTGEAAGVAAGAALTKVAAATGPAAPFVAAAGAFAELLFSFVGGGCGSACVDASKAAQIYIAAYDDLNHVAQLGMLTADQFETGVQDILQAAEQAGQNLAKTDPKASSVMSTVAKSCTPTAYDPSWAAPNSVPLDIAKAQTVFVSAGASGWYSDSVAAGNQLALSYLNSLDAVSAAGIVGTAGISLAGVTVSWNWLLLAALAIGGIYFVTSKKEA